MKGLFSARTFPQYIDELKRLDAFAADDLAGWEDTIQDAINWGLLSPMGGDDGSPFLRMQPVFPYILQTKVAPGNTEIQAALTTGFKRHYQRLAESYLQLFDASDPEQKRLGLFLCKLEEDNLYNALHISLKEQDYISTFFCLDRYLFT